MSIENLDYEEFAENLREQAVEAVPEEFNDEQKDYIVTTLYNFARLSGEELYNDFLNFDGDAAGFVMQVIAEWSYHKSVDLIHSEIPKEHWDGILQHITFTIFEVAKQGIQRGIVEEKLVDAIEHNVNKAYQQAIGELEKKGLISKEVADRACVLSNIDDMAEKDNTVQRLENIMSKDVVNNEKVEKNENNENNFSDLFSGLIYLFLIGVIVVSVLALGVSLTCRFTHIPLNNWLFQNSLCLYIILLWSAISIVFFVLKYFNNKVQNKLKELEKERQELEDMIRPEKMYERLGVDILSLRVGAGLLSIADPDKNGQLLAKYVTLRKNLADELGYVLPHIRILDSTELEDNEYSILIRNNVVAGGYVYPNKYMVNSDEWDKKGNPLPADTICGIDPTSQQHAYYKQVYWLNKEDIERTCNSMKAIEADDVIIKHLKETVIKQVDEIMESNNVLNLIELVKSSHPILVEKLIEKLLSEVDLRKILVNLIREKVSIKDIVFIFEKLCDYARYDDTPDILSEKLRIDLARQICLGNADNNKELFVIKLSLELDNYLGVNLRQRGDKRVFLIDKEKLNEIAETVAITLQNATQKSDKQVIILCSEEIRLSLYRLLVSYLPTVAVMSYPEITDNIKVVEAGTIEIENLIEKETPFNIDNYEKIDVRNDEN